jgi:hypothetical protein
MSEERTELDRDGLIEQLRARAADPKGRTEYVPSVFETSVRSMSLGGLMSFGQSVADSLRRVVDSNQAGRMPDPDVMGTAEQFERDMSTPAPAGSLRRALPADVEAAEAALGVSLPAFLRRLYLEVADGGFGPGRGLLSLERLVREARELRKGDVLPRGRTWPAALLPLVDRDPGWYCIDIATGAIVEWDPEDLAERSSEERFRRSFTDVSPSIETWLAKWLRKMAAADRKPSEEERWARMAARAQTPEGMARQEARTRRYLAQMSPEDRRKFGFDELYPDIDADDTVGGSGSNNG